MNKKGATIVEYALIISLIAVAVVSTINKLRDGVTFQFVRIDNEMKKSHIET